MARQHGLFTLLTAVAVAAAASLSTAGAAADIAVADEPSDASLTLVTLTDAVKTHGAACLDGSPPAYYWRPGKGADKDKIVTFLMGGGWCFPNVAANISTSGDNCVERSRKPTGTTTGYAPTIPASGIEGGGGMISGDSTLTRWANWSVAYVIYCDGGCFSGMRDKPQVVPDPAGGGHVTLHYRGRANLDAVLDDLKANRGLDSMSEVVVSGCSAGGQSCYLHCDYIAGTVKGKTRCICDAGMFLDVANVDGSEAMRARFDDVVTTMNVSASLPAACTKSPPFGDPKLCFFSQNALAVTRTPTLVINSQYNFFVWERLATLAPPYAVPDDWVACAPRIGGISPATWAHCNATQREIITQFRSTFLRAAAPALSASTPHGAFLDACPGNHCQTSGAWSRVKVGGKLMSDAVAEWYFDGKTTKLADEPFPGGNAGC